MIARSSALSSAGRWSSEERDTASNRHCCEIGSTGFTPSIIARRSARLSCRAFVPKRSYERGRLILRLRIAASTTGERQQLASMHNSVRFKTTVYAAIELSKKSWVVAIARPDRDRPSIHRIAGGNLTDLIGRLRKTAGEKQRIVVCYEAGYDGFWLARSLAKIGSDCHVLD